MKLVADSVVFQMPDYIAEIALVGVIALSLVIIVTAPVLLRRLVGDDDELPGHEFRINITRGFFAIALLFAAAWHPDSPVNAAAPGFIRFLTVLFVFYLYYVLFYAAGHFNRSRFGRSHSFQNGSLNVDTYRSRSFTISMRLVLTALLIMIVVNSMEADDLLRTSGIIAALLVVVGLSQSAWAPDYIGGLLILYSGMFKEGDTVKLVDSEQPFFGEIYRIKAFHTEILSFVDNHRVLIRNSRIREYTIHNLSKFASAKGLREKLSFKIGYDVPEKQVEAMFRAAFQAIHRDHSIAIERHLAPEIRVQETGDHAVEWSVYYFTKETRRVLRTRQLVLEIILKTSKKYKVSLATPLTHQMEITNSSGVDPFQQGLGLPTSSGVAYGRQFTVPFCVD